VLGVSHKTVAVYQHAFGDGFAITLGLLVVALVIGIIDLRQRVAER
jgi:hypothetical protein